MLFCADELWRDRELLEILVTFSAGRSFPRPDRLRHRQNSSAWSRSPPASSSSSCLQASTIGYAQLHPSTTYICDTRSTIILGCDLKPRPSTMSELAFCKSFLTALDARPAKLSSDHIADARQYPAQGAVSNSPTRHTPSSYHHKQSLIYSDSISSPAFPIPLTLLVQIPKMQPPPRLPRRSPSPSNP
jgi:hypothetical protein